MFRLDDKILTTSEFLSLTEFDEDILIEKANQLHTKKHKREFERTERGADKIRR